MIKLSFYTKNRRVILHSRKGSITTVKDYNQHHQ